MADGQQSLAQVKEELLDKIDAVDRKVDAVDRKVDAVAGELRSTRAELVDLVNATATGLERHMDKKLEQMEERMTKTVTVVAEAAADRAVNRVLGTVFERAAYDAAVFHDKVQSLERRLNEHISDENVHSSPRSPQR
jgi:tetrahydromethanopterin S-methyltransferase subunit G